MSRKPARFTQADVARALKALLASGMPGHIEIKPDGTISIYVRPAGTETEDDATIVL
jgi:hypothetical protein